MSAAAEDITLSKSARKRANQKARAAEEVAEEAPPAPAPKAATKAKAAPAPAAAEPKSKAKAKAKAEAKAEPAPKAEAKAKAKGKAAPAPKEEPKKEEPKAAAKPAAKAAGKAAAKQKPKKEEDEEPVRKDSGVHSHFEIDDGRGGDWEVSSGLSKGQEKQAKKKQEKAAMEKEMVKQGIAQARGSQYIPGMAPVEVQLAGGKAQAKAKSVSAILAAAVDSKGKEPEKAAVSDNSVSATVKVPEAKIGRVVGPKGANVNLIKEKTGVKTIDISGDLVTIVGPADGVALAEHAVRQLIDKGYMSLAYDDFEEEGVAVFPSIFPDLIGSKGVIIQLIKKEAKVEIDIPPVPKNAPAGKKFKVMLAGSKAAVTLGKEIVNSIAMYGHHEVTHPGQVHQEMEVEEWRYRYLIGTKGSEMRHIQNNYKVKVSIPREHSMCQNVVVVGEPRDVERAIKYIEKVMYEADQPKGRGAADKAIDDGADDGPVEDWMKAYMYQRK